MSNQDKKSRVHVLFNGEKIYDREGKEVTLSTHPFYVSYRRTAEQRERSLNNLLTPEQRERIRKAEEPDK